jgi:acyl-CoA reductase-like NAD-dependent aldehyde dehydrogenase
MEMIGTSRTETEDERSKRDSKLRKFLKDSGIKVYAIGITGDVDTGENRRLQAENFLSRLTKETGGKVVFSRSKQADIDKLVNQLLG